MEFKQNKGLPAEKQIVTADPDINIVCFYSFLEFMEFAWEIANLFHHATVNYFTDLLLFAVFYWHHDMNILMSSY